MRILSIDLFNYIGIYNGTGKSHFNYVFDTDKHIIAITGKNGSGKSTLLGTLHPFPDSNDSFIPGKPAGKTISYEKDGHIYTIIIEHKLKTNGERNTPQVAVIKDGINLNENLNVSSAKEIIMNEFELDSNYITLSQLSSDDRGLADKKPAERKKFVNDILTDLEAYNNMYKILNKKSLNSKSIINNISREISSIGDENIIKAEWSQANSNMKKLNDEKDKINKELGAIYSAINAVANTKNKYEEIKFNIDQNNTMLQNYINQINIKLYESKSFGYDSSIFHNAEIKNYGDIIKDLENSNQHNITILSKSIEDNNKNIEEALAERTKMDSLLSSKQVDLSILNNSENNNPEEFIRTFEDLKTKKDGLYSMLKYPKILDTDISISIIQNISFRFKELYDEVQQHSMHLYNNDGSNFIFNETGFSKIIEDLQHSKYDYGIELAKLKAEQTECEKFISDIAENVPNNCKNKTCYFYKLRENSNEYKKKYEILQNQINDLEIKLVESSKQIQFYQDREYINNLIKEFKRNYTQYNDIFKNILKATDNKKYKYDVWEDPIGAMKYYNWILSLVLDDFNIKTEYETISKTYTNMLEAYMKISENINSIKETSKDIEELQNKLTKITYDINNYYNLIDTDSNKLSKCKECEAWLIKFKTIYENYDKVSIDLLNLQHELSKYDETIKEVKTLDQDKVDYENKLNSLQTQIDNQTKIISDADYKLRSLEKFKEQLNFYNDKYQKIETIKKYTSPTTGIQTLFMNTYMNNVLTIANNLLQYMFEGQFTLMPFIINETEFRIPCAGNGYLNDDISSMSYSQICIISMIISFAMLYNSSSCYNIIKLDEIDGGLDTNNRIHFVELLYQIMDIMKCEQCFIISHNNELDQSIVYQLEMG